MKIDDAVNYHPISQRFRTGNQTGAIDGSASFAAILDSQTTQTVAVGAGTTKDVAPIDFTSMTRQEMFDWMNGQIRSGKMSFEESTPFLGMTLKISAATGQPVDMATDMTRINFMNKARLGIEGALSRHDSDSAERLQLALEIMQRNQG